MPRVGMGPIRREQIRRAAMTLIADAGFDRTTLRDVALAAGVSTGMINHYYSNKIALLMDALVGASEWFQEEIRVSIARAKPGADRFRTLVRIGVFNNSREANVGRKIWAWALAESIRSDELSQVIQERRHLFQDIIAEVLRQLDGNATTGEADLRELAAECDSYFNGLAIHLATGALNLSPEAATTSLLALVTARLKSESAGGSRQPPGRFGHQSTKTSALAKTSPLTHRSRAGKANRM
jgi:TetR/AcrR family transcriptional regulator, transcriptional repressor of bet genes